MNFNLTFLFLIGVFFSFLSYIIATIEEKAINKENWRAVIFVTFMKATLGGLLCIIIFHGLHYLFVDMNENLRVGIAGAGAFLTENVKKFILLFINKKVEKDV
ncbi:hypothetical protein NG767_03145 [Aliarcobacter cryaerophilus]|uniref:hypothetical protein n=1 Tax=Aliarcobacter cryaerophilus TaxID=28198 RepID=UPI003DA5FF39